MRDFLKIMVCPHCPRCHKGHIFAGFLAFAPHCEQCGLSFKPFEAADGPAFFVMTIISVLVAIIMAWLEFSFTPPIWVHVVVSFSVIIGGSLILLRPVKSLFFLSYYKNYILNQKQE